MPAVHLKPGEAAIIGDGVRVKLGGVNTDGDGGVTLHVGCGDEPVSIESPDGSMRPLSRLAERMSNTIIHPSPSSARH